MVALVALSGCQISLVRVIDVVRVPRVGLRCRRDDAGPQRDSGLPQRLNQGGETRTMGGRLTSEARGASVPALVNHADADRPTGRRRSVMLGDGKRWRALGLELRQQREQRLTVRSVAVARLVFVGRVVVRRVVVRRVARGVGARGVMGGGVMGHRGGRRRRATGGGQQALLGELSGGGHVANQRCAKLGLGKRLRGMCGARRPPVTAAGLLEASGAATIRALAPLTSHVVPVDIRAIAVTPVGPPCPDVDRRKRDNRVIATTTVPNNNGVAGLMPTTMPQRVERHAVPTWTRRGRAANAT